jgi:uncharacterized protein YkwD
MLPVLVVTAVAAVVCGGAMAFGGHGGTPVGATEDAGPYASTSSSPVTPSAPPTARPSTARPAPSTTPKPSTRPATPRPTPTPSGTAEQQVLQLVNQQRAAAGCRALRSDGRLAAAARGHSQDMADHHYFSHTGLDGSTFVDRIAAAGYPRQHAGGENIAAGYPTAAAVMAGWMASPGHRANILDCGFRAIGVGLAHASDGTAYWTQDFGRV